MEVIYIESKVMKLLIRSKKNGMSEAKGGDQKLSLNITNKTKLLPWTAP